jgi:hypothetical protein
VVIGKFMDNISAGISIGIAIGIALAFESGHRDRK